jgi:serine/threonine protein kinase/Tol biopolymer transport system component
MDPDRHFNPSDVSFGGAAKPQPQRVSAEPRSPSGAQDGGLNLDSLPTVHQPEISVPKPGAIFGHYRILHQIGSGGMGVVFRALDTALNRPVAIKIVRPENMSDRESRERLFREATAAAAFNHPNIVTVYEAGEDHGCVFIAMELVAGRTLHEHLAHTKANWKVAVRHAIEIASGLAAAHDSGIVHRDLKPANIMVSDKGAVKIVDFGLAKPTGPATSKSGRADVTAAGLIVGTCAYMSPEQAEGKSIDHRSDIFSFGSILYETLSGRRAFDRDSNVAVLSAILDQEPVPLRTLVPDVPPEIERLVARCHCKRPEERWQHALDLRFALEDVLARSTDAPPLSSERRPRFRRSAVIVAVAAVMLAVAGAGWALSPYLRKPPPPVVRPEPMVTLLTTGAGFNGFPAISRDGKLMAFASDRAGKGNLDIWVQQIDGGDGIQVTFDDADDTDPAFSPDGTRVLFRSEREGGGVYTVATLGGSSQLLARGGRNPSFSPDGRSILYWTGKEGGEFLPGSAKLFVMPADGGVSRQIRPDFGAALFPLWIPGTDKIVFLGRLNASEPFERTLDWWVAPLDGPAQKMDALVPLRQQGLRWPAGQFTFVPVAFSPEGEIVFPASHGDAVNLWTVPFSMATGKVALPARRLTFTTGFDLHASSPIVGPDSSRMIFSSLALDVDVWSVPLDADAGVVTGPPARMTESLLWDAYPSLTSDGTQMAFASGRTSALRLKVRDLRTGADHPLPIIGSRGLHARISGNGDSIVFWDVNKGVFLANTRGGASEQVCAECGPPTDYRHADTVLFEPVDPPDDVMLLDLRTHMARPLVPTEHGMRLYGGRLSPDGRWVAFHAAQDHAENMQVFVAPARRADPAKRAEWVAITDGKAVEGEACWSPRGELLYFLSDRDGFRCIWARKFDPRSGRPAGAPFPVSHFHTVTRSLKRLGNRGGLMGLSVAPGRVIIALGELTGNVWLSSTKR